MAPFIPGEAEMTLRIVHSELLFLWDELQFKLPVSSSHHSALELKVTESNAQIS